MTEFQEISLLYTAGLRGDLDLLPRLYTFLKTLRGEFNPAYVIDLGESCAVEIWHCEVTEGRSMLIALDGMGYTAANTDHLTPDSRAKLTDQVALGLVNADHPHVAGDCLFALHPTSGDGHLCIVLKPGEMTRLAGRTLDLEAVEAGQVGIVRLTTGDVPQVLSSEVRLMPSGTAPDPTIAGVVDFVISEARYYQRRAKDS
ncbi:MAG TPA: hypothetical protein VHL11_25665 [Phototrophicaceae bacterium]|jgi:hypothetical protein|nr:hypothetical protein [Phototrophicaceae bacterium]